MTKPDDPRKHYIAIASHLFATQGFHGASLSAVAAAAGVSKQALLYFFKTKARLYAEVLTDLAARQCAEIDAACAINPEAPLLFYFKAFRDASLATPDDVQLVVRALLDADSTAKHWPMKPYLDRLVRLARSTPGGKMRSEADTLAFLSHLIGAIHYMAISTPAVTGMYGDATAMLAARAFDEQLEQMVTRYASADWRR